MMTLFAILATLGLSTVAAQERAIVAEARPDPATVKFDAALNRALGALAQAGSYAVQVESKWNTIGDPNGPHGGSHYLLQSHAGKYRVEVQSQGATSPDLLCVNDGHQLTTLFPSRKLYSQHDVHSREATLEANKMLAISLQGSALDILLQPDVAHFVHAHAKGLKDHGEATLDGKKAHRFELVWAGATVELWFATEGRPLLLQFTRTTSVPTGMNEHYQMVCTAKYQWQLGQQLPSETFALALPAGAEQVNEIYEALSGQTAASRLNQPLPKLQLSKLDGSDLELTAAADKKATVLIFWATWCASSVEDLAEAHKFVAAYKDRSVAFYAVNVGEQPGAVRRFTAKHPLVSAVLLDPRGTASTALHVTELPAVAIIAPDNTVRAILHGSAKELQGELASQLDALLAGATSKTARRPGETGQGPK
jgi:hypothetical protein